MISRFNRILLVILILAVIAGWFLLWSPSARTANSNGSTVESISILPGWDASEVISISFVLENGFEISLNRDTSGSWSPVNATTDQDVTGAVEMVLAELLNANIIHEINTGEEDAMGLSVPTMVIHLTRNDGVNASITIGDVTPFGEAYYVKLEGGIPFTVEYNSVFSILDTIYIDVLPSFLPTQVSPLQSPLGPESNGIVLTPTP